MQNQTDRLNTALAGRYRILRHLGEGGMASVYLCEDIKHDRQVALKLLKPELAAVLGAERFVQEIKTTAALQHPHILPLFDSGAADGFLFYVMPFIDGETLRTKLDRETQLGIDDAVRIAREVLDALDYAHTCGIVHRDVKPENILLHGGHAMVADFGIALAVSAAAGGRMTETGLSLGTPHYMSPEQATAEKEITPRSDVYSLGSVLYEMLTGNAPFTGANAQQIIMKIITEPAEVVTKYRKAVPPNVAAAVAKSLEKLPADRFETAKAFADALHDTRFTVASMARTARTTGAAGWSAWLREPRTIGALVVVAVLTALAGLRGTGTAASASMGTVRLSVVGPKDTSIVAMTSSRGGLMSLRDPVVSADGTHLLFSIATSKGASLSLRALNRPEFRTVVDSGANGGFFSPDGSKVGFFVGNELWSTPVADVKPSRVSRIPETDYEISWADWHPDGRILVAGSRGLWEVPAAGGVPRLVVANDTGQQSRIFAVQVLHDGRLLLTRVSNGRPHVEVRQADGGDASDVLPGLAGAIIVDDIVFYYREGGWRAATIDPRSLKITGEAVSLIGVSASARPGRSIATYDTSTTTIQPVYLASNGTQTPLPLEATGYRWPRLSPNGRRLAIGTRSGLRVVDLERGLSWAISGRSEPVWTPNGDQVISSNGERPSGGLVIQVADGSRSPDTLLTVVNGDAWPTSVSSDGAWLAYYGTRDSAAASAVARDVGDLFFMDLKTRTSQRLSLPGEQRGARFSPRETWIAYQSKDSGSSEIHLRDWPRLASRYVVTTDGGEEPSWSADGRTLFYRRGGNMMAVTITESAGTIAASAPRVAFTGTFRYDPSGDQSYDVAPDGRFVLLKSRGGDRVVIDVVLNWIDEVRAQFNAVRK